LRLFSFGGYGLALAALALVVFGAYDSFPFFSIFYMVTLLTYAGPWDEMHQSWVTV